MTEFYFNGRSCADFGAVVIGANVHRIPARDVSRISIPGRNGEVLRDNGRWKNVEVEYRVLIRHDFNTNIAALRAWLCSSVGYVRLEDTIHPDEYRMAAFVADAAPTALDGRAGVVTLTFDCLPQRWLKSGEEIVEVTTTQKNIRNPGQTAAPLLRIFGNGRGWVSIKGVLIDVLDIGECIEVDCETQQATRNDAIKCTDFPVFRPGWNMVGMTGGVTKIEIIPRWWIL